MPQQKPTGSKVVRKNEQSARFLKTACVLGADKDEGALDHVLGKVVLPKVAEKPDGKKHG